MVRSPNTKENEMSFRLNRVLDVLVAYAVLGLTLTVAGATAVLGA
jgi:CHASE1-domain containing sensor protein